MIPADWIIENDLCQILCVVLEFLSKGEGLDCFSRHLLPKHSRIIVPVQSQWKGPNRVSFDLPKVSKMNIIFELLKVSKMTSLKIYISPVMEKLETKFGQQVNITERVPLGTLSQVVVMSLAHNHMANLFISSYRGATVCKFGQ